MCNNFEFPSQGFIFWPVGTGDSTTIVVDEERVVQVDLHHLQKAEDDDEPHVAIIDELERHLPEVDGEPYLSVFVLTHPDQDHCQGFADLLDRVRIGEIWFTPRVFREYAKDFCDDAKAFRKEAKRRVAETIRLNGNASAGDRVRIIGYDDLLEEKEYEGFPKDRLTVPGSLISELDGDYLDSFRAFVHAPFKDDSSGERNETSVALQIRINNGVAFGRTLLLGDLCYPTIRRIFDYSEDDDVLWNVFLAPHHCGKSVMYWQDEGEEEERLKTDILDDIEDSADPPGYIVASCEPIPASNQPGDNPPHAKAKNRYQEIAPDGFLCTHERPTEEHPQPIVFELKLTGFELREVEVEEGEDRAAKGKGLAAAVSEARGANRPPSEHVGFGNGNE